MDIVSVEPHIDITIDENEVIKGAKEIIKTIRPTWPIDQLLFKEFKDGITNKLVGLWYPEHYSEMILIRIYGHKTDLFIDRKAETRNIRILNKAGYTHSIYATFNNGLAYEFIEGETLTIKTVRDPIVYQLIARRMAQMHRLKPIHSEMSQKPFIWPKTEAFLSFVPKAFANCEKQLKFEETIKPFAVLKDEYNFLYEKFSHSGSPVVYAHNDLLLGNILYDEKKNSVTFIDFEYTAYNYQAFDIANHFAEFAGTDHPDYSLYPDKNLQKAWLKIYLEAYNETNIITEEEVEELYGEVKKFVLLSHFFWGCWALIQSEHSHIDFDFLEYAAMRFNEYFKRKSKLGF
ncbi:ethanolamine kinase [Leptopilina boulardi]|uniref:ethanolamine kinase n=1 Tax=Leptopilina boulardi TaxID=63433 RepID=UPI0021F538B9|nr:ethanolamine kinase [Leptopilina boulardi]XP_051169099.1 ethanolamine kinase [Leptopilina boulardi]